MQNEVQSTVREFERQLSLAGNHMSHGQATFNYRNKAMVYGINSSNTH